MNNDLELGIATMFRDATMESIITELRRPADWEAFNKIKDMARANERDEHKYFEANEPKLLAEAREELIDKAGSLTFEHPTPFGTDKFSKAQTDRQARSKIEHDHQTRLLAIRQSETDALDNLRDSIQSREGVRDHARDAFSRATDRRDGEDRRIPTRAR